MRRPSDAGSLPPTVMYQHAELTAQCFLFATFAKGFADTIKLTGSQLDILFNNGTHVITALVEDLPTPAFQAIFEAYFINSSDGVNPPYFNELQSSIRSAFPLTQASRAEMLSIQTSSLDVIIKVYINVNQNTIRRANN